MKHTRVIKLKQDWKTEFYEIPEENGKFTFEEMSEFVKDSIGGILIDEAVFETPTEHYAIEFEDGIYKIEIVDALKINGELFELKKLK